MKYLFLLFPAILISCNNPRVRQLEKEKALLKSQIDSMNSQIELAAKHAQKMVLKVSIKAKEAYDSVIVAQNLKVIRVNEACGTETHGDLLRSIEPHEQKLEELKIQVIYTNITRCGYELKHGSNRKIINGALTGYDLALEIEKFYKVKLLD